MRLKPRKTAPWNAPVCGMTCPVGVFLVLRLPAQKTSGLIVNVPGA